MIKQYIIITSLVVFLLTYSTGLFQFWVFGDFTYRLGKTFTMQEDDIRVAEMIETRWKIIHFIDQF